MLNSQEGGTGQAAVHAAAEPDASDGEGGEEPHVLIWKSQILNYAAEPGVLAHANSHCQRGNGNRTVFSFKFRSEREKVNLHRAWGWGEDDRRGWCNQFSFLHKLQMNTYG